MNGKTNVKFSIFNYTPYINITILNTNTFLINNELTYWSFVNKNLESIEKESAVRTRICQTQIENPGCWVRDKKLPGG